MSPDDLAKRFATEPGKIEKYNQAISLLLEIGFDNVMRRLGEPDHISKLDPNCLNISAFDQMERRGWYNAVNMFFDFHDFIKQAEVSSDVGDFGAKQTVQNLGYNVDDAND